MNREFYANPSSSLSTQGELPRSDKEELALLEGHSGSPQSF
jgi:hypothetical protein